MQCYDFAYTSNNATLSYIKHMYFKNEIHISL